MSKKVHPDLCLHSRCQFLICSCLPEGADAEACVRIFLNRERPKKGPRYLIFYVDLGTGCWIDFSVLGQWQQIELWNVWIKKHLKQCQTTLTCHRQMNSLACLQSRSVSVWKVCPVLRNNRKQWVSGHRYEHGNNVQHPLNQNKLIWSCLYFTLMNVAQTFHLTYELSTKAGLLANL